MKTVEQKAEAYDKVVSRLKSFMMQGVDPLITRADVQDFFPELSEPEDEKIRKELIQFIKNWKDPNNIGRPHDFPTLTRNVEQCDRYIAWLEKQGDQKPIDKIKPKFKIGDWVVYNYPDAMYPVCKVIQIDGGVVDLVSENGSSSFQTPLEDLNANYHLKQKK